MFAARALDSALEGGFDEGGCPDLGFVYRGMDLQARLHLKILITQRAQHILIFGWGVHRGHFGIYGDVFWDIVWEFRAVGKNMEATTLFGG